MSLDLAMDFTKHHDGHSSGLYFLTLVFPAAAVLIYAFLVSILIFRKLEEYKSLGKWSFLEGEVFSQLSPRKKDTPAKSKLRSWKTHSSHFLPHLVYIALALVTFSVSQLILFDASYKIATRTSGRLNGSMFAIFFDLASVSFLYKFWNTITDGMSWRSWNPCREMRFSVIITILCWREDPCFFSFFPIPIITRLDTWGDCIF